MHVCCVYMCVIHRRACRVHVMCNVYVCVCDVCARVCCVCCVRPPLDPPALGRVAVPLPSASRAVYVHTLSSTRWRESGLLLWRQRVIRGSRQAPPMPGWGRAAAAGGARAGGPGGPSQVGGHRSSTSRQVSDSVASASRGG